MGQTTRTKTRLALLLCGAGSLTLGLGLPGCGAEPGNDDVDVTNSALGLNITPTGLTCGVAYKNGSNRIVDGVCAGAATLSTPPLGSAFTFYSDGDAGLSNGNGFYHQSYRLFTAGNYDTSNLNLPQGTVCGFKHTGHGDPERCIAADPELGNCPFGWTLRIGGDAGASSGSNYVWCEYNDSHGNCPGNTCVGSLPSGTACGMVDSDRGNGFCEGVLTGAQRFATGNCPGGFTWSYASPPNGLGSGFYDAGRSSGHGLGWCRKN